MKIGTIWFAVDENGDENWFNKKPFRRKSKLKQINEWVAYYSENGSLFPGAIRAITGKNLTWDDDPLEWEPEQIKNDALTMARLIHFAERNGYSLVKHKTHKDKPER